MRVLNNRDGHKLVFLFLLRMSIRLIEKITYLDEVEADKTESQRNFVTNTLRNIFDSQLDFIKNNFMEARYLENATTFDVDVIFRIMEAVKRTIIE